MKTFDRSTQMNSVLNSTRTTKCLSKLPSVGLGLVMLSSIAMISCAPKNARLVSPAEAPVTITDVSTASREAVSAPKVDVLFVIDTSESMTVHQENLKKNVGRFVEAFEANKNVDFHIGVVSIFDSKRFGPVIHEGFYPLGLLRPLKDPARPGQTISGPQYVTRTDGYATILGATLEVGIEPRCGKTPGSNQPCPIDLGGPEFEDSFSPVMAALNGQNTGFYRPDAQLAVIFVTDADDDSPITPDSLARSLKDLKGGDSSKVSAFGVLSLDNCPKDPSGPAIRISELLKDVGGSSHNLCGDDFGGKLASVGKQIEASASAFAIPLSVLPSFGTIVVKYGDNILPPDEKTGWVLDTVHNSIVIGPDAPLNGPKGTKFTITYVAVDVRKLGTDKVKTVN